MSTRLSESSTPFKRHVVADCNAGLTTGDNARLLDLRSAAFWDDQNVSPAYVEILVKSAELFFLFSDSASADIKTTHTAASTLAKTQLPVLRGNEDGVLYIVDTRSLRYLTVYDAADAVECEIQSLK